MELMANELELGLDVAKRVSHRAEKAKQEKKVDKFMRENFFSRLFSGAVTLHEGKLHINIAPRRAAWRARTKESIIPAAAKLDTVSTSSMA